MRPRLPAWARWWRATGTALGLGLFLLVLIIMFKLFAGANGSVFEVLNGNIPPPPVPARVSWPQGTTLSSLLDGSSLQSSPADSTQTLALDPQRPIASVDPAYLSFAIDSAQLVGSHWWDPKADKVETNSGSLRCPPFDFKRPGLDTLTKALSPAYFRLGGSEADRLWYDLSDSGQRPAGYAASLSRRQWDEANHFAIRNGLEIIFTLNAGPGPRQTGRWDPANAKALISYSAQKQYPVAVWEFGNELNGFWFIHGLNSIIDPGEYARDLASFSQLAHRLMPSAKTAGQGSAFWPVVGEPFSAQAGYTAAYLKNLPADPLSRPDIVGWHYYPQQSRRAPVATRRAAPGRLLDLANLNEAAHWSVAVSQAVASHLPQAEQWLSETGNAQFGGEPGVSDTWLGSLWWLDQLGAMARLGNKVVVRQTLIGLDYGLLDQDSLRPRPDYWVSLLWKGLMGTQVYAIAATPNAEGNLRVYAHSAGTKAPLGSRFCTVVINLDPKKARTIALPAQRSWLWLLNAPEVAGKRLLLNGNSLDTGTDPANPLLPALSPVLAERPFSLLPLSAAFIAW